MSDIPAMVSVGGIAAIFVVGIYKIAKASKSTIVPPPSAPTQKSRVNSTAQAIHKKNVQRVPDICSVLRRFNYDYIITGVSYHLTVSDGMREGKHIATLEHQPSNPYDSNAVAVKVAGKQVGWIAKEKAKAFHGYTSMEVEIFCIGGSMRVEPYNPNKFPIITERTRDHEFVCEDCGTEKSHRCQRWILKRSVESSWEELCVRCSKKYR